MTLFERIPYFKELPELYQTGILLLIAVIIVWVLRSIIARMLLKPLRNMAQQSETQLDDQVLDTVERPLRILIIGIGVIVIASLFEFTGDLDRFSETLSSALILAAVTFFVYNLVDIIALNSATLQRVIGITVEERLLPFLRTVAKVFVLVMGSLIILQEFGYNVSGLVASFGVVGLAFSLAAKDTAANVFGFTAIVSDNPFQVGDYIDGGGFVGTVEHVGVRSTRIRKLDQSLVSVPNSKLTDAALVNWSRLEKRRLDFMIGLTYATTAAQMRIVLERLRDMLKARENIDEESVVVHFVEFADSSLNIRIIAYLMLADWGEFTAEVEEINLAIMEVIEELGLSMAFPSQSLYLEAMPNQLANTDTE